MRDASIASVQVCKCASVILSAFGSCETKVEGMNVRYSAFLLLKLFRRRFFQRNHFSWNASHLRNMNIVSVRISVRASR